MNYRLLGRTQLRVSEIGFGAWAIGGGWGRQNDQESLAALTEALELGINFFDTAAGYGQGHSEKLLSLLLSRRADSRQVIISTKIPPRPGPWPPSPYCAWTERYPVEYLESQVDERLRNLDSHCIDILLLHTWTRAWNRDPGPLEALRSIQRRGKVRFIGISTPEHDQNALIDPMRNGWLDVVEVIYNIFEQEPAAEFLPTAQQMHVGVIARMPFEESALTGKLTQTTQFAEGDFRRAYFQGSRLGEAVARVEKVQKTLQGSGYTLPQAALKFVLAHPAVSTTIPGMRNPAQVRANAAVSGLPDLPQELLLGLRRHNWLKAFWYGGNEAAL